MDKKGIAIIELLMGFLILSMLIACFLKASLFEEETLRIEQAKREFPQIEKQSTNEKEKAIIDVEEDEKAPPKPVKQEIIDRSLIPQFLEILD